MAAAQPSASHPCGTQAKPGTYKHVIWIWFENHSSSVIIGSSQAPYFNTLAKQCGLATNFHNITHPSLPNYIAATSGPTYSALPKFLPDCSPKSGCNTSAKSIFGQGESWKSYEESMPSNCDRSNSGNYAVRHNPAAYYTTLHSCSSSDVPYSHLASDLVISPSTKKGARSGTKFNHYSLLGTAEQLLRLSKLGQAASSPTLTKAFNL